MLTCSRWRLWLRMLHGAAAANPPDGAGLWLELCYKWGQHRKRASACCLDHVSYHISQIPTFGLQVNQTSPELQAAWSSDMSPCALCCLEVGRILERCVQEGGGRRKTGDVTGMNLPSLRGLCSKSSPPSGPEPPAQPCSVLTLSTKPCTRTLQINCWIVSFAETDAVQCLGAQKVLPE